MPADEKTTDKLKTALARFAPRHRWRPADRPCAEAKEIWFEIPSVHRPAEQKLVIRPHGGGDIQIEYHWAGKAGSPFEMLLLVGCGSADCAEHAAQFVADLIAERLVLAYKKGVLSGGREFLRPGDLTHKARRGFAWVTSWQGTYDWQK